MDPRLLRYYNQELQHVRDMGAEFARDFPKIAGRLGMEGLECADPYVERLLEGFAFLAARVQLKIDAEFPRFTQHLLEIVYPHYLAPTPSMVNVELQPNLGEGSLAQGYRIARGSDLRSVLGEPPFDVTELAVPSLFGVGDTTDASHRRDTVDWLGTHVPGAAVYVIDGSQHGAHLSHPDRFAEFVRTVTKRATI